MIVFTSHLVTEKYCEYNLLEEMLILTKYKVWKVDDVYSVNKHQRDTERAVSAGDVYTYRRQSPFHFLSPLHLLHRTVNFRNRSVYVTVKIKPQIRWFYSTVFLKRRQLANNASPLVLSAYKPTIRQNIYCLKTGIYRSCLWINK